MPVASATQVVQRFEARGAVADLFRCRDTEVLIHGPAGTGKTRGVLEKIHLALLKYPQARALVCRKTRSSMTNSVLVTYEQEVLVPGDRINFHTPTQAYPYPNRSSLVIGGLDDSQKIMSSQYDIIFVAEATETVESDWSDLKSRLRNFKMPYQQIIADCNPAPPSHWLWRSAQAGNITAFASMHKDNPVYWDTVKKDWTAKGKAYLKILDDLPGIRRKRLFLGIWCTAEGVIYENWNPEIHRIPHMEIPYGWCRYWAVDFGYTNPFSWLCIAEDPDGRLYVYRQIYHTQRTVSQHCQTIASLNEPRPRAVICDHDAEDRATLEQELKVVTIPANKGVSNGIQRVTDRLRVIGDNKPRVFFLQDSLLEEDKSLKTKKLPLRVEEEFDSYVWDEGSDKKKEQPIKQYDHGMDALRYAVVHIDGATFGRPDIRALN